MLLEGGLRVRVDAMGQVDDLVPRGVDGRGGAGLEVGERLGGAGGGHGVGHGPHRIGRRGRGAANRGRQLRSADSVSSATTKIAARNTTIAGWKASTSRSTTIAATNRPTQPPRRVARNQSPW